MNPFDFVKLLHTKDKQWDDFNDEEKKAFNVFIINRALSMNPDYLDLVNLVQRYTNGQLTPKEAYNVYMGLLPSRFKYFKWVKGKSDKSNKDLLEIVAKHHEVSQREAADIVSFMPKKDLKKWLKSLGLQDKDIKKLAK